MILDKHRRSSYWNDVEWTELIRIAFVGLAAAAEEACVRHYKVSLQA